MKTTSSENIKVLVRIRPKSIKESLQYSNYNHLLVSNNSLRAITRSDYKQFTFDHIATENSTQQEVFTNSAKEICDSVLQGYNGTIFVYGQTGAGKTYTLFGPSHIISNNNMNNNNINRSFNMNADDIIDSSFTNSSLIDLDEINKGILPRTIEYLFYQSNLLKNEYNITLSCSFLEIYMEQLSDLLNTNSNQSLNIVCTSGQVSVDGLTKLSISSVEEAFGLINKGNKLRHIASTSMNKESSRSHAVFSIYVKIINKNYPLKHKESVFHLIDLAGSERQKSAQTSGERLREAGVINKSLMCLSFVIQTLSSENGNNKHIHYRDSKLTFLLKDSLGGNSKTCVIANVSPLYEHMGETISTLCFAQRAKQIKNQLTLNELDNIDSVYQKETLKLKDKINEIKAENLYLLSVIEKSNKIKNEDNNNINDLNNNGLVSQIEQITSNISQIDEEIKKLTNEENFIKDKIQKYCLDITLKEKHYNETNGKISALIEKINEMNSQINEFKSQNKHLNEENIQNTLNMNLIKTQNNQTIVQIDSLIERAKQTLTIKNENLEKVIQERNDKEQNLKDKQLKLQKLLHDITDIQTQNENYLKQEQSQKEQIINKEKQINTIKHNISQLISQTERCKKKLNDNQIKKEKLCYEFENEIKQIPKDIDNIELETKNTKHKFDNIEMEIKENISLQNQIENELYMSHEQIEELKHKINNLQKEEMYLNNEIDFHQKKNNKILNDIKQLSLNDIDNINDINNNNNNTNNTNDKTVQPHSKVKLLNQHKAKNVELKEKINELKKEEDSIRKKISKLHSITSSIINDNNIIPTKHTTPSKQNQKPSLNEIVEIIDNQFQTLQTYHNLILQSIGNTHTSSSKEIETILNNSIDKMIQQSITNQQCIAELKEKYKHNNETISSLNRELIDANSNYNEKINYSIHSFHEDNNNNISFEDKKRQTISSGSYVKTPEHINIYKRVFTTKRKYDEYIKFDISDNNKENIGITRVGKSVAFFSPFKTKNKLNYTNKCLYTQVKLTKRKNTFLLPTTIRKEKIKTPLKKTFFLPWSKSFTEIKQ